MHFIFNEFIEFNRFLKVEAGNHILDGKFIKFDFEPNFLDDFGVFSRSLKDVFLRLRACTDLKIINIFEHAKPSFPIKIQAL